MHTSRALAHIAPGRVILGFTFLTIIIGTLLLALPSARHIDMSWLDLFFTSVSSTCVTGMFTVSIDQFTLFGHCVILGLMQIGGLGLVTFTLFALYFFFELNFGTQLLAGNIFEVESWKQVKSMLSAIIGITFFFELLGTIVTFLCIHEHYTLSRGLFLSLFHSVSSFCNAGISLFDDHTHYMLLKSDYSLLGVTALLMFAGSFGFNTWIELSSWFRSWRAKRRHHFSLTSKIIMTVTLILLAVSTVTLFFTEYNAAFAGMPFLEKCANALFNAIAIRSTGLLTVTLDRFSQAGLMIMTALAFIGAAPGSTGSGIKITTFALFLLIIKTTLSGSSTVNVSGRKIVKEQLLKAITIASLTLIWIALSLILFLSIQPNFSFVSGFLETISALTNVGLATGITSSLIPANKVILIISMIIGRIGSLTLMFALRKHSGRSIGEHMSYPEERIMLS